MTSWIAKRYRFEREYQRIRRRYPLNNDMSDIEGRSEAIDQTVHWLCGRRYSPWPECFVLGLVTLASTEAIGAIAGGVGGYHLSSNHPVAMTLGGIATGMVAAPTALFGGCFLSCKINDYFYHRALRKHHRKA